MRSDFSLLSPLTSRQEVILFRGAACGDYAHWDRFLRGDNLCEPIPKEISDVELKVHKGMKFYLPAPLPEGTPLKIYAEKLAKARGRIRKRKFIGSLDKVVNGFVGPVLSGITDGLLHREAAFRSFGKTKRRLERYRNVDIDAEYKGSFRPFPRLQESMIQLLSFTEIFSSAGIEEIEVCAATTQGKRLHNEDTVCAHVLEIHGKKCSLFGLFDGHSGDKVAKWLQEHMKEVAQDHLSLLEKPLEQADQGELENMLTTLSVKAEQELRKALKEEKSGATFTGVLIIGPYVYVCNTGDSRVLLLTKDKTIQLTEDATPTAQRFRKGVEKRGGNVTDDGRVDHGLNVARSVEGSQIVGITSRGKVTCFQMTPHEPYTIMMGSDGVFESNTSRKIANKYRQGGTAEAPLQEAFMSGSQDNISVVIINIGGPLPKTEDTILVDPRLSRITDKLLRRKAIPLSKKTCIERLVPWKNQKVQEYNIDAPPRNPPVARPELSFEEIKVDFVFCDPTTFENPDALCAMKKNSKQFGYQNFMIEVQNERICVFGLCDFRGHPSVVAGLSRFVSGIIKEEFLSFRKPLSKVHLNVLENILSFLPLRVEQKRRTYTRTTDWGSDFLFVIQFKNAVWTVRTNGFMGRVLALQGDQTFQLTQTPSSGKPGRAQVTRRVFASDTPLTFIIGSEQLFDTCTPRQLAGEFRDKKTPEALIQKAHTTGSGDDLTAFVLEASL